MWPTLAVACVMHRQARQGIGPSFAARKYVRDPIGRRAAPMSQPPLADTTLPWRPAQRARFNAKLMRAAEALDEAVMLIRTSTIGYRVWDSCHVPLDRYRHLDPPGATRNMTPSFMTKLTLRSSLTSASGSCGTAIRLSASARRPARTCATG